MKILRIVLLILIIASILITVIPFRFAPYLIHTYSWEGYTHILFGKRLSGWNDDFWQAITLIDIQISNNTLIGGLVSIISELWIFILLIVVYIVCRRIGK